MTAPAIDHATLVGTSKPTVDSTSNEPVKRPVDWHWRITAALVIGCLAAALVPAIIHALTS
ncbi:MULTISPECIES: hypothetical protein [unclassified Luteibacter]|uniref:hypothetical protein n=1 Tax=Luteibacter sp. PvP019 TaxID=3156436 RepID=UPI003399354E